MSHSEDRSKQNQTTSTAVQNLNVQDTDGVTIANSDNVQVLATDFNAIESAGEVALSAIESGRDLSRQIVDLGFGALDTGKEFLAIGSESIVKGQRDALDFAESGMNRILTTGVDFFTESLASSDGARDAVFDLGGDLFSALLTAGRGFFDSALDTAKGALSSSQSQVGSTVSALQSIAKEQTTSDSARLQQVVLYALGAVVVLVIFGGRARG